MQEICSTCGLPKDLCVCVQIAKESQKIKIKVIRRKFRKFVTQVNGFDKQTNVEEICKELKRKLACGGTVKDDRIELQGNHSIKVKEILIKNNFPEELIDVV
ncbi:MAG: stress response translation initiation inhibitor YciH [Candidatus Diapherotrites archaeon]|nr:stress response translation initiation inhibitor YciH [Candidatus Diapherotrites archaeon]